MTKSHIFWCPKPGVPGSKHIASYSEQDCDNTCRLLSCWLHLSPNLCRAIPAHERIFYAKPCKTNSIQWSSNNCSMLIVLFMTRSAVSTDSARTCKDHRESCSAQMISLLATSFSCWMTSTASPGSYLTSNQHVICIHLSCESCLLSGYGSYGSYGLKRRRATPGTRSGPLRVDNFSHFRHFGLFQLVVKPTSKKWSNLGGNKNINYQQSAFCFI